LETSWSCWTAAAVIPEIDLLLVQDRYRGLTPRQLLVGAPFLPSLASGLEDNFEEAREGKGERDE